MTIGCWHADIKKTMMEGDWAGRPLVVMGTVSLKGWVEYGWLPFLVARHLQMARGTMLGWPGAEWEKIGGV